MARVYHDGERVFLSDTPARLGGGPVLELMVALEQSGGGGDETRDDEDGTEDEDDEEYDPFAPYENPQILALTREAFSVFCSSGWMPQASLGSLN